MAQPKRFTIECLADKIIEMTGRKSKKEFVPYEVAYGRPIEDMMQAGAQLSANKKGYRLGAKNDSDRYAANDY